MDPDAALTKIRNAATIVLAEVDAGKQGDLQVIAEAAEVLAEAFQGLDGFLSAAGFLPFDWMSGRKA